VIGNHDAMSLRVLFIGGPADGRRQEYPHISEPLPRLWWRGVVTANGGAVYKLADRHPDRATGRWCYEIDRDWAVLGPADRATEA
jgi:hypothetical protein